MKKKPTNVSSLEELKALQQSRRKDRTQFKTKRFKQIESLPQPMDELLKSFFKQDQETIDKIDETRAVLAWEQLVGPSAARVSQALRIRNGQLIVRVVNPLWMQELSLLKRELLRKYQTNFPSLKIKSLFFVR